MHGRTSGAGYVTGTNTEAGRAGATGEEDEHEAHANALEAGP